VGEKTKDSMSAETKIYFKGKLYDISDENIEKNLNGIEYAIKVDGTFKNHKYAVIDKANKKAYLVDFYDKQNALPYGNAMNNIRKKMWKIVSRDEAEEQFT
jgi:hypothetical protein